MLLIAELRAILTLRLMLSRPVLVLLTYIGGAYLLLVIAVALLQRRLLYLPTHDSSTRGTYIAGWAPWMVGGEYYGFCRQVPAPKTVWFMMHGNGGEAADRAYILRLLDPGDALYALEYPGYGSRAGRPSRTSIDAAALAGYRALVAAFPDRPICLIGESLGSGPACVLASQIPLPAKIVLAVPFDTLTSVAAEQMPWVPARLLLLDRWNNLDALWGYRGKLEIYGAIDDRIIPYEHAKKLAAAFPSATFTALSGGHNDWAGHRAVQIRN